MANLIALDVGTKRIGVAVADTVVPVAIPLTTLDVDGTELDAVRKLVQERSIEKVIVGYPRNQAGDATEQTAISEAFGQKLQEFTEVAFQDESLTSVVAEERLKASGKPYDKTDIDAVAATIILQDYLEANYGS